MQAIIFDVDNTLIEWKSEFIFALKKVLIDMGYNFEEKIVSLIDESIENYEKEYNFLTKENLLSYINKITHLDLPIEFIDNLIIEQGNCIYEDSKLIDTIKYLSQKYDLYAISNWFTYTQVMRLEKMGVINYFKLVLGADNNFLKPDKRAFDIILNKYNAKSCISIGDSLECDIEPAKKLGMNTIWLTKKHTSAYRTISNICELKEIL